MNEKVERIAIYLFARCEQLLADFAGSHEISARELTQRVAGLFQAQAGGQVLGPENRMSELPGTSSRNHRTPPKVALAERTSGRTQIRSRLPVAKIHKLYKQGYGFMEISRRCGCSEGGVRHVLFGQSKSRPNKLHWTQRPENKARVQKQLRLMRKGKKA